MAVRLPDFILFSFLQVGDSQGRRVFLLLLVRAIAGGDDRGRVHRGREPANRRSAAPRALAGQVCFQGAVCLSVSLCVCLSGKLSAEVVGVMCVCTVCVSRCEQTG